MAIAWWSKGGDDDHPAYADHQISEAMVVRVINAIAAKAAIWAQSAIVITCDESDGCYDHVQPRILTYGPDSLPLSRGNAPIADSLISDLNPARLEGTAPPLAGSYAMIPDQLVETLPHRAADGCAGIGVTPVDVTLGRRAAVPGHFNSLPATLPDYNSPAP